MMPVMKINKIKKQTCTYKGSIVILHVWKATTQQETEEMNVKSLAKTLICRFPVLLLLVCRVVFSA